MELRSIPGFPGYFAREDGTIWSCKKRVGAFRRPDGLIVGPAWINARTPQRELKTHAGKDGYLCVNLSRDGDRPTLRVHRLVCLAFHGCPPNDGARWDACHNDGSILNNVPSNLRWATPKENMRDQYTHGTRASKLTEDQVRMIRRDVRGPRAMARELGISHVAVINIRAGRRWKHVQ